MTRDRLATLPADDWRRRNENFQEPQLTRNLALVETLTEIADRHDCAVAEAAIAWTLHNPAITAAIVGVRRPEQIDGVVGAASVELTDEDLALLDAV